MTKFPIPPTDPPDCPTCGNPPWRKGRLVSGAVADTEGNDAELTCCRHCMSIWRLDRRTDGTLAWVDPTDKERAFMLKHMDEVRNGGHPPVGGSA